MIKKICCLMLCLLLIVPCAFAEDQPRRLTESDPAYAWLYEKSMELAGLFQEALSSDAYISLHCMPDQFSEEIAMLRMQDFSAPLDVTVMRADSLASADQLALMRPLLDEAALPQRLEDMVWRKVYLQMASVLNGQEGTQTLALSSVLTISEAYPQPEEMDGPCFAVMFYGGLYAFLVTFFPTGNGAVMAQAAFIHSRAADQLPMSLD